MTYDHLLMMLASQRRDAFLAEAAAARTVREARAHGRVRHAGDNPPRGRRFHLTRRGAQWSTRTAQ